MIKDAPSHRRSPGTFGGRLTCRLAGHLWVERQADDDGYVCLRCRGTNARPEAWERRVRQAA